MRLRLSSLFPPLITAGFFATAEIQPAFAQPAPANAAARVTEKTLFLVRAPDGITPIRAVSYAVQGPVVVLENETGSRAVVQTRSVIGRLPWVSDAEIEDGSADLAKLAAIYENYARRVPLAREFLNREAQRFQGIVRTRVAEQAAREKAAAERLRAVTTAVYDAASGYTEESLERLLQPAEELSASSPEDSTTIEQWAAPFRGHLTRLKAGDRYENGAWITQADLEMRARAEREAAFQRTIDYEFPAEALPSATVRGVVFRGLALTLGVSAAGLALIIGFRRGRVLRLVGLALCVGAPLALAGRFFLATRTPGPLPLASGQDETTLVIAALSKAAGVDSATTEVRAIPENALNGFLARHVHFKSPETASPGSAIREGLVVQLTPGRLALFERLRALGFTWIVRHDLTFAEKGAPRVTVDNVWIGALRCPPALAEALWRSLEAPLRSALERSKIPAHFDPKSPTLGAIPLHPKSGTTSTSAESGASQLAPDDSAQPAD